MNIPVNRRYDSGCQFFFPVVIIFPIFRCAIFRKLHADDDDDETSARPRVKNIYATRTTGYRDNETRPRVLGGARTSRLLTQDSDVNRSRPTRSRFPGEAYNPKN